jgi:hypothetical protein
MFQAGQLLGEETTLGYPANKEKCLSTRTAASDQYEPQFSLEPQLQTPFENEINVDCW